MNFKMGIRDFRFVKFGFWILDFGFELSIYDLRLRLASASVYLFNVIRES